MEISANDTKSGSGGDFSLSIVTAGHRTLSKIGLVTLVVQRPAGLRWCDQPQAYDRATLDGCLLSDRHETGLFCLGRTPSSQHA